MLIMTLLFDGHETNDLYFFFYSSHLERHSRRHPQLQKSVSLREFVSSYVICVLIQVRSRFQLRNSSSRALATQFIVFRKTSAEKARPVGMRQRCVFDRERSRHESTIM